MLHQSITAALSLADRRHTAGQTKEEVRAGLPPLLADAASHTADALPELLILARGGDNFDNRARPYLNEVIHCLASALESALLASYDIERAGIGAQRRAGEDGMVIILRDYLDRAV